MLMLQCQRSNKHFVWLHLRHFINSDPFLLRFEQYQHDGGYQWCSKCTNFSDNGNWAVTHFMVSHKLSLRSFAVDQTQWKIGVEAWFMIVIWFCMPFLQKDGSYHRLAREARRQFSDGTGSSNRYIVLLWEIEFV